MAKRTLRFLTRRGRILRKTFKTLSAAKRAVRAWRAAGGKMASSTRRKRRTRVILGRRRRSFIHKSRGRAVRGFNRFTKFLRSHY